MFLEVIATVSLIVLLFFWLITAGIFLKAVFHEDGIGHDERTFASVTFLISFAYVLGFIAGKVGP